MLLPIVDEDDDVSACACFRALFYCYVKEVWHLRYRINRDFSLFVAMREKIRCR